MPSLKLGEIDLKRKPIKAQLFLCKPNKQIIKKMNESYDINFSQKLGALNELTFKLPIFLDIHHKLSRNANADVIKGRYLVKLVLGKYEEYFLINNIEKVGNEENLLDIQALSLGFELNDKIIRDYEVVSKTATELLTDMLVNTIWNIGYIDSEFDLKYRGFEVSSNTVLELVFEIAKTFNALIVWDTINRKINFFKPDNIGQDRGFKIKYGKYLESLNQEDNSEEIITRLKMYGKEDISIRAINPTGTNYIEDFTYFIFPYEETKDYTVENYTANQIISDWSFIGNTGDWSNNNGKLKLTVNSNSRKIIFNNSDTQLNNYKINGLFTPIGNDDDIFGMVVRYTDENNYYFIGYESGGFNWSPNHLKVFKVKNGISTEIGNSNGKVSGWSSGIEYKISVEVDNDIIKVWINNILVLSVRDAEHKNGAYGFYGHSQVFEVSDIVFENKSYTIKNHSDYMSDELCHHLLSYDKLLQDNKDDFEALLAEREMYEEIVRIKNNELFDLETDYKILLDERDVLNTRIAQKEDQLDQADNEKEDTTIINNELTALKTELNLKLIDVSVQEDKIEAKENEIIVAEQDLQEVDNEILQLKILLDVENNFPKELLDERNQYIIEKEWQNSNIDKSKDLLKEGIIVFNEFKQQKITLRIDVVNFLSMVGEQRNWDKLNLSDTFTIEHSILKVSYKAKITEVNYNFEDDSIEIQISNVKDLYSNKDKFLDMLYKSYSTSTQVSIDSWKWDLSMKNKGSINEIINNKWDANKQAIVGAKDQVVEISDRGLIIRDPNDPMTYLVGINGMIAITNDGGSTFKHAITSTGIVGERVYGKVIMGVNLAIEDEHGIVKWQGSKGEIFDRNGDLVMKLGLVDEEGLVESFGMSASTDVSRVNVTNTEGFSIEQNTLDGWEKIFWTDQSDGTIYAKGLVAESVKIVNDVGEEILNAETGYFNLGKFKDIVIDNKFTTIEKMQIITELNQIYSGYKILLDQAQDYQRVSRDNDINENSSFNTTTQKLSQADSISDRYSTTPLKNSYIDLIEYMKNYIKVKSLNPHDPLSIDVDDPLTETTSEIPDRATFILMFKNYYDEAKKLRNAIEDAMFYTSINMGEYYNNIVMGEFGLIALRNDGKYRAFLNATNGLALQKWENNQWVNKIYASIGNPEIPDGTLIAEDLVAKRLIIENSEGNIILNADELSLDFTALNSIVMDNVIMPPEKVTVLNQYKGISKQYTELLEQVNHTLTSVYSDRENSNNELDQVKGMLETSKSNLQNAYSSLTTYLNPVWTDMNAKTHIVNDLNSTRTKFYQKFENFYLFYEECRNNLQNFLEKSSVQLGKNYNRTVIDAVNGISVEGLGGEVVRMNAQEGFAIDVNNERRIWIHTDGTIRARKLIVEPEGGESELILDEETDAYISDLMVNSLKSIPAGTQPSQVTDYVYIRSNFLKLMRGTSASSDIAKFVLHLNSGNPRMIFGEGNSLGNDRGYIVKTGTQFKFQYTDGNGKSRKLQLNEGSTDSILLETINGTIRLNSDTKITLGVGTSNYIQITSSGVKVIGDRIDLN